MQNAYHFLHKWQIRLWGQSLPPCLILRGQRLRSSNISANFNKLKTEVVRSRSVYKFADSFSLSNLPRSIFGITPLKKMQKTLILDFQANNVDCGFSKLHFFPILSCQRRLCFFYKITVKWPERDLLRQVKYYEKKPKITWIHGAFCHIITLYF